MGEEGVPGDGSGTSDTVPVNSFGLTGGCHFLTLIDRRSKTRLFTPPVSTPLSTSPLSKPPCPPLPCLNPPVHPSERFPVISTGDPPTTHTLTPEHSSRVSPVRSYPDTPSLPSGVDYGRRTGLSPGTFPSRAI